MSARLENFLKLIERYGYAVLRSRDADEVLKILRECGAIHLVQVHRLPHGYTVIEIVSTSCHKECDVRCRDVVTGKRLIECYNRCVEECIMDKIKNLTDKVRQKTSGVPMP